jgi:hypothetical protein
MYLIELIKRLQGHEYPCTFFEECGPLWLRENHAKGIDSSCATVWHNGESHVEHYVIVRMNDTTLKMLKRIVEASVAMNPNVDNILYGLIHDAYFKLG